MGFVFELTLAAASNFRLANTTPLGSCIVREAKKVSSLVQVFVYEMLGNLFVYCQTFLIPAVIKGID